MKANLFYKAKVIYCFLLLLPVLATAQWEQLGQPIYGEQHPLASPSTAYYAQTLGKSVSLSADGSVMALGAPTAGGSSSAFLQSFVQVFRYVDGDWVQIGEDILGGNPFLGTPYMPILGGYSLALSADGNTLVIGEPQFYMMLGNEVIHGGRARVFQNIDDQWVQIGEDILQVPLLSDDGADWSFGRAVDISADGSIIAVGGEYNATNGESSGQVKVFKNVSGEWTQMGNTFYGTTNLEYLGRSISLSDDGLRIVISIPRNSGFGEAKIYEFESDNWNQIGTLTDTATGTQFGNSVSISGDGTRIAVGIPADTQATGDNPYSGKVKIYQENSDGDWLLSTTLEGEMENMTGERLGETVNFSGTGNVLAVGHMITNFTYFFGWLFPNAQYYSVKVYQNINDEWILVDEPLTGQDDTVFHRSNVVPSLSYDGSVMVLGVPGYQLPEHQTGLGNGRVIVYQNCILSAISAETEIVNAVCNGETVEITSNAAPWWYETNSTLNWYDNIDSIEPIFTGSEYITPELSETTTYWVEAISPTGCPSSRVEVTAIVNPTPELTIESFNPPCEGSAININVESEGNTINWYSSETSTEVLFTGTEFTTPELSETAIYWVEAVSPENCISERNQITVTVNPLPILTVTDTTIEICDGLTAMLNASSTGNNIIVWYDSADATQWIATGAEFTTPELTQTTSYWVQSYNPQTHCVSDRVEIVVNVNSTPSLTIATPSVNICENSSTILNATSDSGNLIIWYDSADATQWIATGTEFTTPELTQTTSYWVQSYNPQTHCVSERIEIIIIVNESSEAIVEFSYATSICIADEFNPIPDIVNGFNWGGIFSANPSGLSIDSLTGEINLNSSLAGNYTISYTINSSGCFLGGSSSFDLTIKDLTDPIVEFGYDEICTNQASTFPSLTSGFIQGGTFYSNSGLDVNSITGEINTVNSNPGIHTIIYEIDENPNICTNSARYEVEVIIKACMIQKGISPNGDSANNSFDLTGMGVKKLTIFNRYGMEVYSKTEYVNEWTGLDKKGNELPDGTYFYVIHKNTGENISGWVYINRKY